MLCKVWTENKKQFIRCDCQHETEDKQPMNIDVTDLIKAKCVFCNAAFIKVSPETWSRVKQ
jgi:hypothetical protein